MVQSCRRCHQSSWPPSSCAGCPRSTCGPCPSNPCGKVGLVSPRKGAWLRASKTPAMISDPWVAADFRCMPCSSSFKRTRAPPDHRGRIRYASRGGFGRSDRRRGDVGVPDPFVADMGRTQAVQRQFGVMGQDPEQMRRGMTAMVAAGVARDVAIAALRGEGGVMVVLSVKPWCGRECIEREAQVADQDQQYDQGPQGPPSRRAGWSPPAAESTRMRCDAIHGRNIAKSRLDREPSPARAPQESTSAGDRRVPIRLAPRLGISAGRGDVVDH